MLSIAMMDSVTSNKQMATKLMHRSVAKKVTTMMKRVTVKSTTSLWLPSTKLKVKRINSEEATLK